MEKVDVIKLVERMIKELEDEGSKFDSISIEFFCDGDVVLRDYVDVE